MPLSWRWRSGPRWAGEVERAEELAGELAVSADYSIAEAEQAVASGAVDAIAFGTAFLANPDLPARVKAKAPLNAPDPATFYAQGAKGYTDYPTMKEAGLAEAFST